jgi:hypothetical protein
MGEVRLKSGVWVAAVIRSYDAAGIPVAVVRRGDADSGSVLVKLNQLERGCSVFAPVRTGEGELVWMRATGPAPVSEGDCDGYIEKALRRDPDLWVIEIEDREGRCLFEGRVV